MSAAKKHSHRSQPSASSSSFDEDEEESDEDAHREQRAVAALCEYDDFSAVSVETCPESNNAMVRNKPASDILLGYTEVLNLFNRLHICGIQQRQLPAEFTPACISSILLTVKPVFCSDASCLQISTPVVLFGDIHGEFQELVKLNDMLGRPPGRSYLYLGDYVDRGPNSLETLLYLMLLKILHPSTVFVLRGNHEDRRVYRHFNFENDLMRIFGTSQGQSLSELFGTVLAYMPLCAIINGEIFCSHGGFSPSFNHSRFANCKKGLIDRINTLSKPVLFRRHDYVADLLWSDPLDLSQYQMPNLRALARSVDEWCDQRCRVIESQVGIGGGGSCNRSRSQIGRVSSAQAMTSARATKVSVSDQTNEPIATVIDWLPNPRGVSYVYSRTALAEFMRRYQIKWIVRGHMYISNGFKESLGGRCITLFSAADYAQKCRNIAAIMAIDSITGTEREFPGRVMRYTKTSLLHFDGALPIETDRWPEEIVNRSRLTF